MSKQHDNFYTNYANASIGYIIGNQLNKGINDASVMTQCIPWRSWTPVAVDYPNGISSNSSLFSIVGDICLLTFKFNFTTGVDPSVGTVDITLPVNARLSNVVGLKYNNIINYSNSGTPSTLLLCAAEIIPNDGTEDIVRIYSLNGSTIFTTATTFTITGTIKYQVSNI